LKNLEKLLERYRLVAGAAGYSPKTIADTVSKVRIFGDFVGDIEAKDVTEKTAQAFIVWLREKKAWSGTDHAKERKLSLTSVNSYFKTVRAFWSFLFKEHLVDMNPLSGMKSPKKAKTIPKTFSEAEMLSVFAQLKPGSRDEVLVLMFLDSGMRLSELMKLPMKRLDLDNRRALVDGKGGKQRYTYFSKATEDAVRSYCDKVRPKPVAEENLILSEKGLPLSNSRVQFIIATIGAKAGLKERLAPHKLRHTFATMSLRYGGNLEYLKRLLGHSDIKTTSESYLNIDDQDVAAGYDKSSPISHLVKKKPGIDEKPAKPDSNGMKIADPDKQPETAVTFRLDTVSPGETDYLRPDFKREEVWRIIHDLEEFIIMVGDIKLDAASALSNLGGVFVSEPTTGEFLGPFSQLFPTGVTDTKTLFEVGESLLVRLDLQRVIQRQQRRRDRRQVEVGCWVLTDLGRRVVLALERR